MAAALLPALLVGAAGAAVSKVLAPKAVKPIAAQPVAQVSPRSNSAVADALAGRRGARENSRTGGAGAEATVGLKSKLGQ